ncbi:MAG: AhpC/TSA family protein [Bacteroidales bacterium]|nr:AhpC/TSA family protein [Bacteroidales bacterium]
MKKILLFLSIAFVLYSCDSEPEFFTISGEIANANGEKLYLVELQTSNINILDSVILNNTGTFSFKGQTDIPKFYAIRTTSNNYLTLIVNHLEQIIITADGEDLSKDAIIAGSTESHNILVLRTKLEESVERLDSLAVYYQSLIGTRELNKVKDSLSLVSQKTIEDHIKFTQNFIHENSNSLAGLMALYQQIAPRRTVLNPKDHLEYFNLIDSSLMSTIPKSDAVKALHAQLEEFKRQNNSENNINEVVGIGVVAPNIALQNPEGDTISLDSLRGKYVLIDFWASWCRPCRVENPNLVKSYEKYHAKGFEIFQVSLDKKKESWLDAIEKDKLNWIHVSDLQYWNSAPAELYKVQSIPASFLLDKQGKIIAKNLRGDALEAKLSELFN